MAPGKRKQTGVALSVGLFVYDFQKVFDVATKGQAYPQQNAGVILADRVLVIAVDHRITDACLFGKGKAVYPGLL
jgi:hypothetical protein